MTLCVNCLKKKQCEMQNIKTVPKFREYRTRGSKEGMEEAAWLPSD